MDIAPYRELKIAPLAVFDSLAERRDRVRFRLPMPGGDWRPVTWGTFAAEIREIASYLAGEGLSAGDRAAIYSANRVEWMSAALAIQAASGAMVPIYPASTAEQLGYVVRHSDARVLFADSPALLARILASWDAFSGVKRIVLLSDGLPLAPLVDEACAKGAPVTLAEVEHKVVPWSQAREAGRMRDGAAPAAFEERMRSISLDQPGVMLYTSGTSGPPKGVPLTHRNVAINGLDWLQCNAPLIDEGAVDLLWLPMSHIFGYGEACLGNTLGFTTFLCEPAQVMSLLPEVRPSVFMSVPSIWEKLAQQASVDPAPEARRRKLAEITGGRFRFCLSGGAGLKREVKEFFHDAGLLIIEGYGLTETSPTLTMNRPDAFRFDTVGKPFPSVQLRLAEDGEILAKGPSVFGGYHKDPEATRAAFTEDGWFKTGDVGRFTEDGFLQIVDRKKDILVTAGGKNVPPANIEIRFRDDPYVAQLLVYGDGKRYLTAGVWPNGPAVSAELDRQGARGDARAEALRALIQARVDRVNAELPSYETIKKFAILERPLTVEDGFLTATLKLRRKRVIEVFGAQLEALYR
ncbi:MAG TPA: AMP-dependent synthetase/ligase [Myxococcales bacterium]|nr:AMP-dependent synthetase/ligase [Myxococcales bacterium]